MFWRRILNLISSQVRWEATYAPFAKKYHTWYGSQLKLLSEKWDWTCEYYTYSILYNNVFAIPVDYGWNFLRNTGTFILIFFLLLFPHIILWTFFSNFEFIYSYAGYTWTRFTHQHLERYLLLFASCRRFYIIDICLVLKKNVNIIHNTVCI